jgi:hypothetical protein
MRWDERTGCNGSPECSSNLAAVSGSSTLLTCASPHAAPAIYGMGWDEMRWDEPHASTKRDNKNSRQLKPPTPRLHHGVKSRVKSSRESSQVESQVKSRVKSSRESSQVKSQVKCWYSWALVGCKRCPSARGSTPAQSSPPPSRASTLSDEMGWDGMGWDGMGWDGMR